MKTTENVRIDRKYKNDNGIEILVNVDRFNRSINYFYLTNFELHNILILTTLKYKKIFIEEKSSVYNMSNHFNSQTVA